MTDTYDYDAWGNALNTTGSTPNVYLYRGEQFDSDLSLYYLRARYFNAVTGRFLSTDPAEGDVADPVTLHKYLYANADPVNRIDPTGWAASGAVTPEAGGVIHFLIGPLTWFKTAPLKIPNRWGACQSGCDCRVRVRCRPLHFKWYGISLGLFEHCYLVTNEGLVNLTLTAGPTNPNGSGCLHVWPIPADPAPENSLNDNTIYDEWIPCDKVKCLKDMADLFNKKCFPYLPVKQQNSNSFVKYAMKWCGMPVSLPWRAW